MENNLQTTEKKSPFHIALDRNFEYAQLLGMALGALNAVKYFDDKERIVEHCEKRAKAIQERMKALFTEESTENKS